ncbi:hypothetical protein Daura_43540 [Dactylosporangium aurantiacum]|uniref:Uncharacterized protein n=1 Tax=Dactylosporangium aurantiacum TaxID=35754 RepID=A0A9Q9ICQ1_9ACTN|nr:hypothetical protein [Dactylosporangium aurantiacum]MDG6102345.1 hypothetical protein [Dactylosporangium aurantiacum]UWZ53356.1 hypothetical protein Daura_43540 [Dactylosporangium aurantiacum]
MGLSRFLGDGRVGTIALVDAPVSRSYAQKARLALFVGGAVGAALASVVLFLSGLSLWAAVPVSLLVGVVTGLALAVLVTAWPVLRVLWWWSVEITAAGLVLGPVMWLGRVTAGWLAALLLVGLAGTVLGVPKVRRWVTAWAWCVVVRHRLRLCFAQFLRSASRSQSGTLPLVLWARPTPAGERVWLWLRPGLDLSDLDGKAGKVAVACWASEVRVARASARYAALLRVDVTRRDPLTGVVLSPLAVLFADKTAGPDLGVLAGDEPVGGLDLEDVPAPVEEPVSRGRR